MVVFQSPWIRFALILQGTEIVIAPKFQSPWIRFAPSLKERAKTPSLRVWKVSIPVDKVRA